jgi:hypothetical protein
MTSGWRCRCNWDVLRPFAVPESVTYAFFRTVGTSHWNNGQFKASTGIHLFNMDQTLGILLVRRLLVIFIPIPPHHSIHRCPDRWGFPLTHWPSLMARLAIALQLTCACSGVYIPLARAALTHLTKGLDSGAPQGGWRRVEGWMESQHLATDT